MQSFKHKVKVLRKILKQYEKHLIRFDIITLVLEYDFLIIKYKNHTRNYYNITKRMPTKDIDTIIKRYRSKVKYEQLKTLKS